MGEKNLIVLESGLNLDPKKYENLNQIQRNFKTESEFGSISRQKHQATKSEFGSVTLIKKENK